MATCCIAFVLMYGIATRLLAGTEAIAGGVVLGLFNGILVALGLAVDRHWVMYRISHASLAARRRVPWRLTAFLDDAHRLGVLRQVGAVYQFRHARLQDRLAAANQGKPTPGPLTHCG